jgi:hypothetical protein
MAGNNTPTGIFDQVKQRVVYVPLTDIPSTKVFENGRLVFAKDTNGNPISEKLGDGVTQYSALQELLATPGNWQPFIASGTISQYWRGDKTWQDFPYIPSPADYIANQNTSSQTANFRINGNGEMVSGQVDNVPVNPTDIVRLTDLYTLIPQLNFTSGLSNDGSGNISLGGSLSQDTNLIGTTQAFNIFLGEAIFQLGPTFFGSELSGTTYQEFISSAADGDIQLGVQNLTTLGTVQISIDPVESIVIQDSLNNQGMFYDDDYSAIGSANPSWIPNWGFIQSQLPIPGSFIQNQNTSSQSANFWINGRGKFTNGTSNLNIEGSSFIYDNSQEFSTTLVFNNPTANRGINIQDGSGTLAFLTDIPSLDGYVTIEGPDQTITQIPTFQNGFNIQGGDGSQASFIGSRIFLQSNSSAIGYQIYGGGDGNLSFGTASSIQFQISPTSIIRKSDNAVALFSTDVSGLVPYTGATGNVNLGSYTLSASQLFGGLTTLTGGSGTITIASNYIAHTSGEGITFTGSGIEINSPTSIFLTPGSGTLSASGLVLYDADNSYNIVAYNPFVANSTLKAVNAPVNPTDVVRLTDLTSYATTSTLATLVPYTGATNNVNLGSNYLITNGLISNGGIDQTGNINIYGASNNGIYVYNTAGTSYNGFSYNALTFGGLSNEYSQVVLPTPATLTGPVTITLPGSSGTLALLSDIPGGGGGTIVSSFNTRTGPITLWSSDVTTALGYIPYNGSTNPSGYISVITSAMVTAALGFTPYNSTNPNGYISGITSGMVTAALGYTPFSNPMTTAGDLIVGGTSGAAGRIAAGTNGYVLTMVSGVPAWAAASGGGGTPAGSNMQLQYNNSGAFGASAGLTWNNANQQLIVGAPGSTNGYLLIASSSYSTPSKIWSRGSGLAFDLDGTGSNIMYWDNNTNGLQCGYITCSSITTGSFSSSLLNIIGRERYLLTAGGSVIWYNGMGNGGGLSSIDWSFTNGGSPMLAVKNSNGNILINSGTDDGVNKLQVTGSVAITTTNTSVSGSTSGSAKFSMPFQGSIFKKVVIQLIGLNGTASYTFPAAFTYVPKVITGNSALATTLSATAITVTGSTTNDTLILEGY